MPKAGTMPRYAQMDLQAKSSNRQAKAPSARTVGDRLGEVQGSGSGHELGV